MGLEAGNYISALESTNPLSSDAVSQGDDHLQLIKKVLQKTFPMGTDTSVTTGVGPDQAVQVLIAEASPGPDTSGGTAANSMGLLWLDTTNNLLKIRNQANDAWIILAVDPETSNSVDINAGTIDGTTIESSIIGAGTPAAGTFVALEGTAVKATSSLTLDTGVDMIFEGATADGFETTVTVTDPTADRTLTLPNATDTLVGKATTDTLTNKTMTSSGNTFDDATTSAKGMASFSSDHFSVSSGAVTIATDGIDDTLIDFGTGTNQVSTADVPEQTNLYYTNVRADARIAAADIGDLSNVDTTGVADDDILKYDSASSTFKVEADRIANHLTTKGDLLAYNTGPPAAEEAYSMPVDPTTINDYVLTADTTQTFGYSWQENAAATAGFSVAMAIAL